MGAVTGNHLTVEAALLPRLLGQGLRAHAEHLNIAASQVGRCATTRVLHKAGMKIGDLDLFEVNEAFASRTCNPLALKVTRITIRR